MTGADHLETLLDAAGATEVPDGPTCVALAREYLRRNQPAEAWRWATRVVDAGGDYTSWRAAATVLDASAHGAPVPRRQTRLAVAGSYTTTQLVPLLRLVAARLGVALDVVEGGYGQYRQEILDPASRLHAARPDFVLLATHEGELAFPGVAADPESALAEELGRWTALWRAVDRISSARVVQHNFVVPSRPALGHLAASIPGSRYALTRALNAALGVAAHAASGVSIVDCERLAGELGKRRWFDPRYWHLSKQAVALEALPLLARETVAVLAAALGLARKCLVLDLDNTLWGGIVGEDGLEGIELGGTPRGEAFVAFQEYLRSLRERGVILAVVSKNNDADAREPFERHSDMRLRIADIACFAAGWTTKPASLRAVAGQLGIGLDAIVFVDDNPVERQAVRTALPEVDVIALPPDPAHYVRALADYPFFETASYTAEDADRTSQYLARADAAELAERSDSLEDFLRSLAMQATIRPFDDGDLPRIEQLIGKTNQFNLTTRRHGAATLRSIMAEPGAVAFSVRLADRFADHGLVGVLIARPVGDALDIDTWLMSCRVIGRTLEHEMLRALLRRARAEGYTVVTGTYIPTAKNELVRDLFAGFGFAPAGTEQGSTLWKYDLAHPDPVLGGFIEVSDGRSERTGSGAPPAGVPDRLQ